ncbi:MAG: hypothetical protein IPJ34_42195 [Myxococcales bacterium]|nr:hypothetical protein [Myxococcales bacterium]
MIGLALVLAASYGDVGVGLGVGFFGPYTQGGTSWGVPVAFGVGGQLGPLQLGIEGRYQRRLFLEKELSRESGSNTFHAILAGSVCARAARFEHRLGVGLGSLHDSRLDGFGFVVDTSYAFMHTDSGFYVRAGAWAGGIFGYDRYQNVAQLYSHIGIRFWL